jgi:hypothetical protein
MIMQEDRMQILKMLEEGKITAEEAARLMDALQASCETEEKPQTGRRLLIKVTDAKTGKKKVNLKIPIGLARIAAKFVPPKAKQKLAQEGVDVDEVMAQVFAGNVGKIVDVESDEENVEITIE